MTPRSLTDAQLLSIIENDEFWVDFEKPDNIEAESDTEIEQQDNASTSINKENTNTCKIMELFEEADESDLEEIDDFVVSDHESESELSSTESEHTSLSFFGKDRTKWSKKCPECSRVRNHNIIRNARGLDGPAKINPPTSELKVWKYIITEDILQEILLLTYNTNESKI